MQIDKNRLIEINIVSAVFFNFVLAIVNNFIPLKSLVVMLVDGAIISMALFIVAFLGGARAKLSLLFVIVFLLPSILAILSNMKLEPKYIRDAMIMPLFFVLGGIYGGNLKRLIFILISGVLIVMFFEAFFLDAYSSIVNPREYYINTRGIDDDGFYTEDSSLFVNAYRPGDRFIEIPFFDLQRVSSVFLEPVSMGNFAIFIMALFLSGARFFSQRERFLLLAAWFLVLAFSDSRFAFMASMIMLFMHLLPKFTRMASNLIMPLILFSAVMLAYQLNWQIEDTFTGRIAETADLLLHSTASQYFLGDYHAKVPVDSGYTYIIYTQTVFYIFLMLVFLFSIRSPNLSECFYGYRYNLVQYVSLSLLISCSVFSIKTAALIFFCYGVFSNHLSGGER